MILETNMTPSLPAVGRRRLLTHSLKFATLALALSAAWAQPAAAQAYPNKPIKLIAPFAAGGAADTVARILAPKLSEALGQPIIIDNRAGASGSIGSAFVAAAPADGYTLLINLGPPHQTVQFFTKGVKYDPVKDFTPIAQVATAPQVMVVPASSPFKSVADFTAAAKASKGLAYATSGAGSSQHLAGLLMAHNYKLSLTHVGYRGGAPALTDVLGAQTDAGILVLSNVLPYIQSGKLRALGLVENHRSKSAPSIPTLAESGLTGFSVPDTWVGVMGPVGLPPAIVQRLHAGISKTLSNPDVRAQLQQAGYDVVETTPAQFGKQLADSTEIYRSIVNNSGITPE
jgi:tripartite-type tricarboxylate transporter receptor subunit TctC